MNDELMSFVASLLEDTQFMMDEYQTPEMAFTAVALDKIVELLDCTDGKTKPAYDFIMGLSLGVDHHLLDNDLIHYDD